MRKLVGLFAGATILVAACGGTSPTTAPARPPTAAPSAGAESPGRRPHRPRRAGTGEVDLFGTTYAPEAGTPGGTIIIGDWQEATQFNPYYLSQVTEANVASLVWHSLLTITNDFKYVPAARGRADPDHRERWRHGRRGRRRDDGHLEAP